MSDIDLTGGLPSELIAEAVAWRRHLHRHPELAFNERKTADFITSQLQQFGLSVHRGLATTGVVGTLKRGTSNRTIAIRADMDGLPIHEESGVPYASSTPGVMHACGHDGHVAMALAAARVCACLPNLDGTVHFIFQPAEEAGGGARCMIDDGLFRLFPCDEIYAMHNRSVLKLGTYVARDGAMMAALAAFEIEVTGRGCHAAFPHQGKDPILAACHLVTALQSIVSRNVGQSDAVVSATQIHAGDAFNVIPDRCTIRGTARWFDDHIGDLLKLRITELSKSIVIGFGCDMEIRYDRRVPATMNDPGKARFVRAVASASPLNLELIDGVASMGSEDFAFMLQAVPGCYIGFGAAKQENNHVLHSPRFDFNDEALPLGAALWISLVRTSLARA